MFKVSTFCLAILALITFNAEAQRAIGRGQSPLTGRGGGSPLGPSNNGGGSITTTNSPSAGYVLTTDGTIYYWGVNTALLTNLPSYALTNFHSVDVVFNAGLAINGASTNNQIAYFNDDISQPYANTAEFGGVYARQFLVASNVTLTGRVTNNTTSGGGFWTADSVGFISISSPNDYILMSHPQGGIVSTLDEWTFGLSGVNIATWSTNNSTIRSNFLVGALLSARNIKLTGGQTASSLLRLDSSTNLATVTIGANLSFDGTTLSATGGGGGGGTNFPNVNLLLGATNVSIVAGIESASHQQTNASYILNISQSGAFVSGQLVTHSVSNYGSSDIIVTINTNSVAANPYDIATKTNVNTFTAAASAITKVRLTYTANGLWLLDRVDGPATILKFGSGITATTNGVNGLDVTISASGSSISAPTAMAYGVPYVFDGTLAGWEGMGGFWAVNEEFLGDAAAGQHGMNYFAESESGGGININGGGEIGAPGVLQLVTTNATDRAGVYMGSGSLNSIRLSNVVVCVVARVQAGQTGGDAETMRIGLVNSITADGSAGFYLRKTNDVWQGLTSQSSTHTSSSGSNVVALEWTWLGAVFDGTNAIFYQGGTDKTMTAFATNSANIPNASQMSPAINVIRYAGTTARQTNKVDVFRVGVRRL